jgi:hypothetical protein
MNTNNYKKDKPESTGNYSIFMGLTEIAGYYHNLKKGFNELGLTCTFVDFRHHRFLYESDNQANPGLKLIRYARQKEMSVNLLFKMAWMGFGAVIRILFFVWAVANHDVFIFGFGSSFFRFYDLPILKLLNKKIIYVFHGSDSRPPYIDGALMASARRLSIEDCLKLTRSQKNRLKKIEHYADVIINYPPQAQFHENRFVLGLRLGIPVSINATLFKEDRSQEGQVRILHSPSHLEGKGTLEIRRAVENLKTRGYRIEYVEISGQPNSVVLQELARCDFVIDQLYSDTPMAGFATEAAFFGKPVVVGGYTSNGSWGNLPADLIPPSHFCRPAEIEIAVEELIVNEAYRRELGQRARQFVQTNWTPAQVARRYLQIIDDEMPADWFYDPQDIRYVHGWGLSEDRARHLVRAMIEQAGKEALQLADKPELERMFIEFAGVEAT